MPNPTNPIQSDEIGAADDRTHVGSASLRDRQHQRVRAEIRDAFVRLAVERGLNAFSLHDVAQLAGVSDRTLYRYFASREALVDDVLQHAANTIHEAQRESGAYRETDGAVDHPEAVAGVFEVFEAHADLVRATTFIRDEGLVDERDHARTEQVRRFLTNAGVAEEAAHPLVALVRLLTGSDGWIRMTSPEFGLSSREAGLAAHWAVQVIVEAARHLDGPPLPIFPDEAAQANTE